MTLTLQSVSCIFNKSKSDPLQNSESSKSNNGSISDNLPSSYPSSPLSCDLVGRSPSASFSEMETNNCNQPISLESGKQEETNNATTSQAFTSLPIIAVNSSLLQPILNPRFMKSSKENYITPIFDAKFEQVILPVECGLNQAMMYLNRLCQGSKGPCILFKNCYWLTPNEFQYISGRSTAKDWKRSIRHNGKSIKLLINKSIIGVHSPLCECGTTVAATSKKLGKLSTANYGNGITFTEKEKSKESLKEYYNNDYTAFYNNTFGASWNSENLHSIRPQPGDLDSVGTWSPRSNTDYTFSKETSEECDGLIRSNSSSSFVRSRLSDETSINTFTAESQSEETSITGANNNMNNNNNNDSPNPPTKSKRKSKPVVLKTERQSPQLSSSTTSPPMTPPPSNNSQLNAASPPPPQPIKQMEQMMGSGRNYSDFMRQLAAKYNNQQQTNLNAEYYSRASSNFAFDTRFLKPAAAAALLNLSCSQIPSSLFGESKDKFPMIDMSSTQTLLSMVRSASAAAANNLESLKSGSQKRPNSPLDLSSRDMPTTPPPQKKTKQRNSLLDVTLKAPASANVVSPPCLSSCSTGCTEEAITMVNWSVEEVCRFVSTIDLCKDYVENFREHAIDGSSLPLLTEEHLMNAMNIKLGPALKFRSTVSKKLGNCVVCSHCTHCHNHNSNNVSNNNP